VKELLSDYEGNKEVREAVDDYFMENGAVLLKASGCGGEWSGTAGSDRCGGSGTAGSRKKRHPIQT